MFSLRQNGPPADKSDQKLPKRLKVYLPGDLPDSQRDDTAGVAAGTGLDHQGSTALTTRYRFLSDEWFIEVRRIQQEHDHAVPLEIDVRMNLRVTETPFGADRIMYMATSGGRADWGEGHLDEADVTLTLGYETARGMFVDGDPQAAIEAFMAGRIVVQGDLTRLMALQTAPPPPGAAALTRALQEITE